MKQEHIIQMIKLRECPFYEQYGKQYHVEELCRICPYTMNCDYDKYGGLRQDTYEKVAELVSKLAELLPESVSGEGGIRTALCPDCGYMEDIEILDNHLFTRNIKEGVRYLGKFKEVHGKIIHCHTECKLYS